MPAGGRVTGLLTVVAEVIHQNDFLDEPVRRSVQNTVEQNNNNA